MFVGLSVPFTLVCGRSRGYNAIVHTHSPSLSECVCVLIIASAVMHTASLCRDYLSAQTGTATQKRTRWITTHIHTCIYLHHYIHNQTCTATENTLDHYIHSYMYIPTSLHSQPDMYCNREHAGSLHTFIHVYTYITTFTTRHVHTCIYMHVHILITFQYVRPEGLGARLHTLDVLPLPTISMSLNHIFMVVHLSVVLTACLDTHSKQTAEKRSYC